MSTPPGIVEEEISGGPLLESPVAWFDFAGATPDSSLSIGIGGGDLAPYMHNLSNPAPATRQAFTDLFNGYIRTQHTAGEVGGGLKMQLDIDPAVRTKHMFVEWEFMFESGFSYGTSTPGGKFGGLVIGQWGGSGGVQSASELENGASIRLQWTGSGQYAAYVYDRSLSVGDFGVLHDTSGVITQGVVHKFGMEVDVDAGRIKVWQDDVLVFNQAGFDWPSLNITELAVPTTFHGGNTSGYAPSVDSFSRVYNAYLYQRSSAPTPITPGTPSITVTAPAGVNNAVDVSWPATTNAVSYELRHGASDPPTVTTDINAVSVERITGLAAGAARFVQVRARSVTGHFSPWSATGSATPTGSGGGGGGTVGGRTYPSDAVWRPAYSGTNPSWDPASPKQSGGGTFTYTNGTWTGGDGRDPTPGNEASLEFTRAGATCTLEAGRIDGRDKRELVEEGRMQNVIIVGGNGTNHQAADPAVFPLGDPTYPTGAGPHRHTFAGARAAYWTQSALRAPLGGLPDPAVDLRRDFISSIVNTIESGKNFMSGLLMYWPSFVDGVMNNGLSQSGYIGRPRNITGVPGPTYLGNVVPPPQGLRLASFQTGMFRRNGTGVDGNWEFSVNFPSCWDGEHEWLPGSAHMAFLQSNGQPPASHPFVIPQIHWFVSLGPGADLLPQAQARLRQSAQVRWPGGNGAQYSGNPAAIIYGQRADYWNHIDTFINPHAELIIAWDPIFAEAMCWCVNNYKGLGRVTSIGG